MNSGIRFMNAIIFGSIGPPVQTLNRSGFESV